jgi:hypothetical protein
MQIGLPVCFTGGNENPPDIEFLMNYLQALRALLVAK